MLAPHLKTHARPPSKKKKGAEERETKTFCYQTLTSLSAVAAKTASANTASSLSSYERVPAVNVNRLLFDLRSQSHDDDDDDKWDKWTSEMDIYLTFTLQVSFVILMEYSVK